MNIQMGWRKMYVDATEKVLGIVKHKSKGWMNTERVATRHNAGCR